MMKQNWWRGVPTEKKYEGMETDKDETVLQNKQGKALEEESRRSRTHSYSVSGLRLFRTTKTSSNQQKEKEEALHRLSLNLDQLHEQAVVMDEELKKQNKMIAECSERMKVVDEKCKKINSRVEKKKSADSPNDQASEGITERAAAASGGVKGWLLKTILLR